MKLPVHRWYRYSAGFSAQWVESLLEPGARVLDPFAGSATTLLAAQAAGAESTGIERHPFVGRVARAKLGWTADPAAFEARAEALTRRVRPHPLDGDLPALLHKCYSPAALADLLGLRDAVATEPDDDVGRLLWLALVAVVRPTSHVGTAQWQYVLPNKRKRSTAPVLTTYATQVSTMAADMRERQAALPAPADANYLEGDCRETGLAPDGWATHVIGSPPYANNYDYADATRLEQTVLGEVTSWGDLKPLRAQLVRSCSQAMVDFDPSGALADPILAPIAGELAGVYEDLSEVRQHHGGKKAYHHMVVAYVHDLAQTWRALRRAAAPGATVCFVVGDSAPYGVHVPVERWLGELAVAEGFESWSFEKVRDRNVRWKNRKHDVPLHEGHLWVRG